MKKQTILIFIAAIISFLNSEPILAQKKKDKKGDDKKTEAAPAKDAVKTIAEATKKCSKKEGLFTLFQDSASGTVYLLIKKDQLNKEYIYFCHIADGPSEANSFRGSYRGSDIFTIRKYFNRIEFVTENTSFYYDKNNPISKASKANISDATIMSQVVFAEDKDKGEFLIKGDELFLSEIMQQIKPSPPPPPFGGFFFSLGGLSKDKSKYLSLKTYPMNTDVVVEYVYDNSSPSVGGGSALADDRYVSIKVQHSFIEVPKNNFKPRYDDPRVGYFTKPMNDMTSVSATPYKDMVAHWNLEKKDKNASISEPVEPIVWWIENTTPVEYRETIKNAALAWNIAFEIAGFKNAVEVKIQSDTATWDAGDIRYNVLRWTSSPSPFFGGYGPSFVNPRTGEILGADIMLEFVFITNRLRIEKVFQQSAEMQYFNPSANADKFCFLSDDLHNSLLFGTQALNAIGADNAEISNLLKDGIYYLILHEMGHTMGLNHNMKASQLYSPAEINNKELTAKTGLTGSVMDYPCINFAVDKTKQGQYFTTVPGPYDRWAIEFAYSQATDNATDEEKRLQKILSRSTEPALMFGNDADDMRSPGYGIDPRVMIDDMSNDAITYSSDRIDLTKKLLGKIREKYSIPNQSYQELRNAYIVLMTEYMRATGVISRYIGGVFVDRAFIAQAGAGKPYTPVAYKDQKRAMEALSKYLFSTTAFTQSGDIYNYLQAQRRGFNFFGSNEDPKIHDIALNLQRNVLNHLMNSSVLKRITDSELYGNTYKLPEFMNDLTNAVFKDDMATPVNTFRQNLQTEYVGRLLEILKSDRYNSITQANTYSQIKNIEKLLQTPTTDAGTKNHRQFLAYKISSALEKK